MIKHSDEGNLRKKGFLLTYGCRGIKSIIAEKAQPRESMIAGGKSWLTTVHPLTGNRKREHKLG